MFACEEDQDGDLRLYTALCVARLVDAASSPEQNTISASISNPAPYQFPAQHKGRQMVTVAERGHGSATEVRSTTAYRIAFMGCGANNLRKVVYPLRLVPDSSAQNK